MLLNERDFHNRYQRGEIASVSGPGFRRGTGVCFSATSPSTGRSLSPPHPHSTFSVTISFGLFPERRIITGEEISSADPRCRTPFSILDEPDRITICYVPCPRWWTVGVRVGGGRWGFNSRRCLIRRVFTAVFPGGTWRSVERLILVVSHYDVSEIWDFRSFGDEWYKYMGAMGVFWDQQWSAAARQLLLSYKKIDFVTSRDLSEITKFLPPGIL